MEEILDEYVKVSKLREKPETPLFPTTLGKSRELGSRPMTRFDGANLLKRRLRDAGILGDYSRHLRWRNGSPAMLTAEQQSFMTGRGQKVLLEDMERIRY